MRFVSILRPGAHRLLLGMLAAGLVIATAAAYASPVASEEKTTAGAAFVTLDKGAVSTPIAGAFLFKVDVAVDAPTSYLESRVQIRNPSGRLLYQKTEVRSAVETGTVRLEYARNLADLKLEPGVYPVELRVRSQSRVGVREWVIEDELLLFDPATPATPVAIVVRIGAAPSMDAEGRFIVDPAESTRARDEADALARLILNQPDKRLTLAIPPVLLEEWLRASQGYSVASIEGIVDVAATEQTPKAYAQTLDLLRRAVATGRLELADVPYGAPDVGALQTEERLTDLTTHLIRGHSAVYAALESSPSAAVVTPTDLVPASALKLMENAGSTSVLVDRTSIESSETTPASGAYRLAGDTHMSALVLDTEFSAALENDESRMCAEHVFARSISKTPTSPIIAVVDVGPGFKAGMPDLSDCLIDLSGQAWARFQTMTQAVDAPAPDPVALIGTAPQIPDAPARYWDDVARARRLAAAFLGAVGVNDPEAQLASDQSLIAQSALWAGPDLNWGSADRGRAIAGASERASLEIIDAITLGASDITLSGTSGEIPVSITNSSDKTLELSLRTSASGLGVGPRETDKVQVRPQENFETVPVDLGQSLSGELTVELWAGDVLVDETSVAVRASFLDRLVLVAGLALVLVGMLLFIRHRVRSASRADTM